MTMFIFHFHSGLRWILLLSVLLLIIRLTTIWLRNSPFKPFDKTLTTVTTSLFDIQLVAGIILLFLMTNGFSAFARHHLEHAFTMLLAIIAVHIPIKWKKRPDPARAKATLIAILVAVALIVAGIARLPQGWNL